MTTRTTSHLDAIIDLVVDHGGDRQLTRDVLEYIADRICTLQLTTALSSSYSSLRRDAYLSTACGLPWPAISACIKLLRGTRKVVKSNGHIAGGRPGMLQQLSEGTITPADRRRFAKLARIAADGCRAPTIPQCSA